MSDPWMWALVAAGAFAAYEISVSKKTPQNPAPEGGPKFEHPPEAAFVTTHQNPWDKNPRIDVDYAYPAVKGLESHPDVAGKWMLCLPGGSQMPVYMSLNKLRRKVRFVS